MPQDLQDVALAVKRVQARHHRAMDSALREAGLTLVQWDALRHLHRNPGASLHDLAQRTFQTDQAFGTLSARMVDRGLVERAPGPGRAVRLRMTPLGEELLARGARIVDETLATSFAALGDHERRQLHDLLRRMLADG